MLTCVLNASEGIINIVIYEESAEERKILCTQALSVSNNGTELLTPALLALFNLYKLQAKDINRYAAINGPGSFTGIRLVLCTIAALRRATGASSAGINYMEALALTVKSYLASHEMKTVCVLTHAKRNLVHCQFFDIANNIKPLTGIFLSSPTQILENIIDSPEYMPITIAGSGLVRHMELFTPDKFSSIKLSSLNLRPDIINPSTLALCSLADNAIYSHEDIEPCYIRPCDAVENLNSIAIKQGLDSNAAHARLEELLHSQLFLK